MGSLMLALAIVLGAGDAVEDAKVRVVSVRRVFHNGEHNAFTDLARFQGKLYLTFRSCPDGHMVHPTASIIVLASDDGQDWRQVHCFHVAEHNARSAFSRFQGPVIRLHGHMV